MVKLWEELKDKVGKEVVDDKWSRLYGRSAFNKRQTLLRRASAPTTQPYFNLKTASKSFDILPRMAYELPED